MTLPKNTVLLKIYLGESDCWENMPLYEFIIRKARETGLAGATLLRGSMGFGTSHRIHTAKILDLSTDLPVVVEMVDVEDRIYKFAEEIRPLLKGSLVTLENVRVLYHSP